MPRQKEFDPEKALDDAMHLFWEKGYEATSVQDLVRRMGINRFSMYDTFGGKHDLFVATLEKYKRDQVGDIQATLENSGDGLGAIQKFFSMVVSHLSSPEGKYACLLVNSIMELATADQEIADSCSANFKRLDSGFVSALKRAQVLGEIDPQSDTEQLAAFLVSGMMGLNVMAKQGTGKKSLTENVNLMLSVLK